MQNNGGWAAHAQKNALQPQAAGEREEDEITPAELAARPIFYPALTLDMLNKNRLQVGDVLIVHPVWFITDTSN